MATITEDYVSFETAKLLKEKRFDESCWSWYHNGNHTITGTSRYCNSELEKYDFSKATLAHVMKWLREVHNIHIVPMIENNGKYICYLYDTKGNNMQGWDRRLSKASCEQACEAAIKYCLENLI
jgi:hypothetical protein